jgi:Cellulase (glycosyl hydrolase family 5)
VRQVERQPVELLTRREVLAATASAVAGGVLGAQAAATGAPRFEIAGHQLRWAGAAIRLVGVAVGDPIYIRAKRRFSDYGEIARTWRANVVRISLHPGHFRADPAKSFKALSRDIEVARAEGLFVIVCWHAIGFPGQFEEKPDPSWGLPIDAYQSDEALALAFWRETAQTFGRDPGVIFELWNEPVIDGKLWVSTGEHWPLVKPLWQRLIAAIRGKSDNIILASGTRWAHDLKGVAKNLIDDPRTAYAWHCYPPADRGRPDRWFGTLDGLAAVKPVVVTEWGFAPAGPDYVRGTADNFGRPFAAQVLEPLNLHSTAWCWSEGAAPQLLAAADNTPSPFGQFVKDYIASARRT